MSQYTLKIDICVVSKYTHKNIHENQEYSHEKYKYSCDEVEYLHDKEFTKIYVENL